MRTRVLGLALATLAVGLPLGPHAFAAPLVAKQETNTASADAPPDGDDASPDTPDSEAYDTSGLLDTESLSSANRAPAATALAAPLHASEDTCMRSRSLGVQAIGFGVSIATTWEDVSCRRLHNARAL